MERDLTLGVWVETAPAEALRDAATWRLLARYGLRAALAVRPGAVALLDTWIQRAREHHVPVSLWPMLDDASGRWLSAANAPLFHDFVRAIREVAPGAEVVLDLEPPFSLVRGALDGQLSALRSLLALTAESDARREGLRALDAICQDVVGSGAPLTITLVPFVLSDGGHRRGGWGRLFGAPWGLPAGRVNLMLYTSLIEGYSRGLLRREDAAALLARGCRAAVSQLGTRASVSLGAVGPGALGDEPVYRSPDELADDAALALGAGVRDLWLFDLGGALGRGAPEPWLGAFVTPRRAFAPPATARSQAVLAALWASGLALRVSALRAI